MVLGGIYEPLVEPTRNEQISITGTSSIVSEARNKINPRKVIVLRNTSTNAADIITVNMGFNQATANNGIVLQKGEAFSDTSETGYESYQGQISAICATANGKLSVFER